MEGDLSQPSVLFAPSLFEVGAFDVSFDMDMTSNCYIENPEKLVRSGEIPENVLDEAVSDVLRLKYFVIDGGIYRFYVGGNSANCIQTEIIR